MRRYPSPFAVFEPAFRRQKDKNQNDDAQNIPLPSVSGVIPKKELFQYVQQIKSILGIPLAESASCTPQDRYESGILASPRYPVNQRLSCYN
jgi:hypothetical protein